VRTGLYTALALIGFAANSLLCRAALRGGAIDAATFTAVRLASGAVVLALIVALPGRREATARAGSWGSALALTAYAIAFSVAYLAMTAGTGALILFGAVQVTMIAGAVARGERPSPLEWAGVVIALGGLAALTAPTLHAPPPLAAGLMAAAGIAWGVYTLRGRGVTRPLAATAGNFARSVPFAAAIAAVGVALGPHATSAGVALAVASGALASGVGYTLWYAAVPALGATRAAALQLAVPVLAAGLAIPLLGERPTVVLALGGAAVVGGIALAILGRKRVS
jgi:drug/metabolite transporter (DMT)-like permease